MTSFTYFGLIFPVVEKQRGQSRLGMEEAGAAPSPMTVVVMSAYHSTTTNLPQSW